MQLSQELQTDMQVLRKEKKANRKQKKALRKQMENGESKQQIAEMEAPKLPMVQVTLWKLMTNSSYAATSQMCFLTPIHVTI